MKKLLKEDITSIKKKIDLKITSENYQSNSHDQYPQFLRQKLKYFFADCITPRKNKKYLVVGEEPDQSSINLMSNDYLSIAFHPEIINSQIEILKKQQNSILMSAIFLDSHNSKHDFEQKLAAYVNFENSILCQSGFVANVGLMQAIADEKTPVYIDFMTHMSLWEGIRSAGAKAYPFNHNNFNHLQNLIKQNGPGIVVVDSVYSTNGSVAPLKEIIEIGNNYGCVLVIDESHSLGTHGPQGSGMIYELGLSGKVHFITASLAKAFAARAGVIFCSHEFSKYFPYISYPAIFSSMLMNHEIAGLEATLKVLINADDLREKLRYNTNYLKKGLDELGYNVDDSQSQIISIESGFEHDTEIFRDALQKRNVFGSVFCRPATSKNRSLIRFSVNSKLTQKELDHILKSCAEVREEVGMQSWRSTKRKKKI